MTAEAALVEELRRALRHVLLLRLLEHDGVRSDCETCRTALELSNLDRSAIAALIR